MIYLVLKSVKLLLVISILSVLSVLKQALDIKVGPNELQSVMSLPGRGNIHAPGYVPWKCQVFKHNC